MRGIGCLVLAVTSLALGACSSAPVPTQQKREPAGPVVGRIIVDDVELKRLSASGKIAFSTGEGSNRRILALKVSPLEKEYKVGTPILITLEITNYAVKLDMDGKMPVHLGVRLSPHLSVWIREKSTFFKEVRSKIDLPRGSRVMIRPGETSVHTIDLSVVDQLRVPGLYDISVGQDNSITHNWIYWEGTLRSRPQTIRIVPE
jgi:hypothetical protein